MSTQFQDSDNHIGRDTPTKCGMCNHHHCLLCPECHRCTRAGRLCKSKSRYRMWYRKHDYQEQIEQRDTHAEA